MKRLLLFLLLMTGWVTGLYAQDNYDRAKALSSEELFLKSNSRVLTRPGQKYLILDSTPLIGGFHRQRYFPGDNIRFRLKDDRTKYNESIGSVSDSTFSIVLVNIAAARMESHDILLSDVRKIKMARRIPFITEAGFLLPFAGLLYIGADFFNKGIDDKRFTTDASTLAVGGLIMGAGFVSYKVSFPVRKIGRNHRLRVVETY